MTKYNTCDQDEYLFYLSSSNAGNDSFDFLLPISADSVMEQYRVLFKNIYNFAGKVREVSLMKGQTSFMNLSL